MIQGKETPQPSEVPWSEIGPFLRDAKEELEAALSKSNASVACLEITLYRRNAEPLEEHNFILGQVGKRMLPDELIQDVSVEQKDVSQKYAEKPASPPENDTTAGEPEQHASVEDEKIVDEKIDEFISRVSEFISDEFSVGLRTIITTRNPGDWCRGKRCEFNLARFQWQWRRYYRQNNACVREWTGEKCC